MIKNKLGKKCTICNEILTLENDVILRCENCGITYEIEDFNGGK